MGEGSFDRTEELLEFYMQRLPKWSRFDEETLSKLVYLADWKAAVNLGEQVTELSWELRYDRPVPALAEHEFNRIIGETRDRLDRQRSLVSRLSSLLSKVSPHRVLTETDSAVFSENLIQIAESVLRIALYQRQLDRLVDATYPLASSRLRDSSRLVELAADYNHYADIYFSAVAAPDIDGNHSSTEL